MSDNTIILPRRQPKSERHDSAGSMVVLERGSSTLQSPAVTASAAALVENDTVSLWQSTIIQFNELRSQLDILADTIMKLSLTDEFTNGPLAEARGLSVRRTKQFQPVIVNGAQLTLRDMIMDVLIDDGDGGSIKLLPRDVRHRIKEKYGRDFGNSINSVLSQMHRLGSKALDKDPVDGRYSIARNPTAKQPPEAIHSATRLE